MEQLNVEMPKVKTCDATECAYNVGRGCHAKAITVGDMFNPECDTFFVAATHSRETARISGVGACKVIGCKYNQDYECSASSITVGKDGDSVKCFTYTPA